MQQYPIENFISKGTYGSVYSTKNKDVVIKRGNFKDLINDINILCQIHHPNIIQIINLCIGYDGSTMIAYPRGENILDYLTFNKDKIPQIFYELLCALNFLHEELIVHCDIKPENIMIINDHPVIIDFGLSQIAFQYDGNSYYSGIPGTIGFISPYENKEFKNINTDVFALGKTFEALLVNNIEYMSNIPLIVNDHHLQELILVMLSKNVPRISEILKLSYFKYNNIIIRDNIGYRTSEFISLSNEPIGDINPKIWYIGIEWLLEVLAMEKADIRTVFLCLHNMHRTLPVMNNCKYNLHHFQLFIAVNAYLALSVFNGCYLSPSFYDIIVESTACAYVEYDGYEMLTDILMYMNGAIYNNTLWDSINNTADLIPTLKKACTYEYICGPIRNDNLFCQNKMIDFNKLRININHTSDNIDITITDNILLNFTTDDSEIDFDKFDSDNYASLAMLYHHQDKLYTDTETTNKIINKIVHSDYMDIYDCIFGNKLYIIEKTNVSEWPFNIYTATVHQIIKYKNNIK